MEKLKKKVRKLLYENACKYIQKYYKELTGKKECIQFYVEYIQPMRQQVLGAMASKTHSEISVLNLCGVMPRISHFNSEHGYTVQPNDPAVYVKFRGGIFTFTLKHYNGNVYKLEPVYEA